MASHARLVRQGKNQLVDLPPEFRFADRSSVRISREGSRVVLEPEEENMVRCSDGLKALAGSAPDFPYPDDPGSADSVPSFDD